MQKNIFEKVIDVELCKYNFHYNIIIHVD